MIRVPAHPALVRSLLIRDVVNRLVVIAGAALLAAAACSPRGPQAHAELAMPDRFSATGGEAIPDRWWQALGDPALDALIAEGLAHNPGLLAMWDRLAQADALVRRERAGIFPSVDGDASASISARGEPGADAAATTSLSLGLAAGYEVDLWGRLGASRDATRFEHQASEQDVQAAAITLSAEIATTWYRLGEQQSQLQLLADQLANGDQTLELVRRRFEHGLVAETDVLRQSQLVESIRGDLALASAREEVLGHRLSILLGRPPAGPAPASSLLEALPALPETGVPAVLLQRRPDLRRVHFRVQSADRRVAAAISEQFPRLSLGARVSTAATAPHDLFRSWFGSLVSNLAAPIIDGGRRRAEVARARAELSERIHLYRDAVLAALGEVEDALSLERRQWEFHASLEAQLELARAVLERASAAYAAGTADYLRVLDAEQTLNSLERRRLQAHLELVQLRIGLYRALAGGWEMVRPQADPS
jgi:NodT family efflux transporter outer membrane factor (OMF) lipoprotein